MESTRLSAYKSFHKSIQRIRLLYEATMHSYQAMYNSGRQQLRLSKVQGEKIEFVLGNSKLSRPLNIVTYHARDVYPQLLRSTLLVRLVASYEAFLVDVVEEVSTRSHKPFLTDGRLDFSQEQLLSIDNNEGIFNYIVSRTLRGLTSGGLKEIRKFYKKNFSIDIVADGGDASAIEEIHDRRHIYVHRDGYPDAEFLKRYPTTKGTGRIPVTEKYLIDSIGYLDSSALHIKESIESSFPGKMTRKYQLGNLKLPDEPTHLQYISFEPSSAAEMVGFSELMLDLGDGKTLKDIVVWSSNDSKVFRMLLGGSDGEMKKIHLALGNARKSGQLKKLDGFKLKR